MSAYTGLKLCNIFKFNYKYMWVKECIETQKLVQIKKEQENNAQCVIGYVINITMKTIFMYCRTQTTFNVCQKFCTIKLLNRHDKQYMLLLLVFIPVLYKS